MGHYAKVENGIVTQVIVADGPDWCEQNLGGECKRGHPTC